MNIDHGIGLAIGVALAGILLVPLCILVVWLVRGYRARLDEDRSQTAELGELLAELKRELETLRSESDRWMSLNAHSEIAETAKVHWKKQYESLVQKHNTLVRSHNVLVRRYNDLMKKAKSEANAQTVSDDQLKAFALEVQSLRERLDRALQGKQDLLKEFQELRGQIETLESERHDLQQKLADTLQPPQLGACTTPPPTSQEADQPGQSEHGVAVLLAEIDELRRQVGAGGQRNDELVSQINHVRGEMGDLAQQLQRALAGLSAGYGETEQDATAGASSVGEQPSSPSADLVVSGSQDTRPVIVGLDFGTYSTKVVVRIRGERKSRAIVIDDPADGYPAFVIPSLVRLTGGKLFFGRRTLQENGGTLFRSLKVALLPPTSRDGWLQEPFAVGTTPDLLVAFYLSWVLGRLKAILGKEGIPQISLNVAAPMDHLEDGAMKERYLHVVHAAWQATFGPYPIRVDQGANLYQFRPLFEFWLERTVPDLTIRRFEILPETLAPLVSLSQDPRVKAGMYMMVDMGAGTTELSISHVNEVGADHRILCYADTSILLGGNQFNENDINNAGKNEFQVEEQRLTKQLLGKVSSVWHGGFEKDMDGCPSQRNLWKQLNVILSGGGLRRPGLQSAIEGTLPMKMKEIFGNDRTDYLVKWHLPADLEFFGALSTNNSDDPRQSLAYLAVAHGLALERQKWPKWHPPNTVESIVRNEPGDDPFSLGYLDW